VGRERLARVTFAGAAGESSGEGKALLETSELIFRGEPRLRIPFSAITGLSAESGRLSVTWPGGTAIFDLGPDAAVWAERIRNPRGLLDKLGVKPGMRVTLLGIDDAGFVRELEERGVDIATSLNHESDLVFYAADSRAELERLAELKANIVDAGAIWVVSRKGKEATLRDVEVIAAAKLAGLVDTKVVSFSDTHTALKLVIPVADRRKSAKAR
jgi:hypothetical protein